LRHADHPEEEEDGLSWIKWLETRTALKVLAKVFFADVQINSRRPGSVTGLKVKAKLLLAPIELRFYTGCFTTLGHNCRR
jgi:hypothetical protein